MSMSRFDCFRYPIDQVVDLEDLNSFLASHRVVSVDKYVVPAARHRTPARRGPGVPGPYQGSGQVAD